MNTDKLVVFQGSDWGATLQLDTPAVSARLQARWSLSDAAPALDLTAAMNGDLARFTVPAAVSSALSPQGSPGYAVVDGATLRAYRLDAAVEAVAADGTVSQPWRGYLWLVPEVVR